MSFQDGFEKRLRRVCGVDNDTVDVSYSLDKENGYGGGCDTCGYGGDEGRAYVSVYCGSAYREFDDLGDLMRALDAVELDVQ